MNIHRGGSCQSFYSNKMVSTIKLQGTAYKMSSPNPNQNTIFWRGLTPEHLEIIPENLYKTTGFLSKWSRHKSTDFSTSLRIKAFCHSFILLPMPPSANPGLSIGNFGIVGYLHDVRALPPQKCCRQRFNPPWNWWLSQHLPSFCIPWFCFQCLQMQAVAFQWAMLE